ncbi:uncharacterized protein F5147DRAFT_647722 [Suillus discolor]|uniref:Uncharacterized protein n=1 Tax=Suillus discolor TaxID=1912936 RepID=A0A9P7K0K7_9AGAM|nr:uncharacterized protein F5147DRAFT_647722 [Suillus discolor]KAG2119854.1 hypothetical protein F5147DRAFT_647722 [Suillus discolor]
MENYFQAQPEPMPSAQPEPVVPVIPGPLIINKLAIVHMHTLARYRLQNYLSMLPINPVRTTMEERCWVTLLALKKEQELQESFRELEKAWRELDETKKVLGIKRN